MAAAHPLHDLLAGLADGPSGDDIVAALREGGHPDLPDGAVAEAIVSYADTAAPEVAEHLAPFVMGHSAVPLDPSLGTAMEVRDGLELVATAPVADPLDEPIVAAAPETGSEPADPADLDFGVGAGFGTGAGPEAAASAGLAEPPAELDAAGADPLEPGALPELDPAAEAGLLDLFPPEPGDDGADGTDRYGTDEYGTDELGGVEGG